MKSKFDLTDTYEDIIKDFSKSNKELAEKVGLGDSLVEISQDPADYVVMGDWWRHCFGIPGLRFGHFVQIAGDSDSGKTSLALDAIRRAQEQGYAVVYVETEGKTSEQDLTNRDIDPNGVITINSQITEEVYDLIKKALEKFFERYPDEKMLLVYDSYGNTISQHDMDLEFTKKSQRVGGAAKTNRAGLGTIKAFQNQFEIAVLIVNYTYDNIGSVGKTNAGGKALNFHTMITLQSARKKWLERQVKGEKVRTGAVVTWNIFKNHYFKALGEDVENRCPKSIEMKIDKDGLQYVGEIAPKNDLESQLLKG